MKPKQNPNRAGRRMGAVGGMAAVHMAKSHGWGVCKRFKIRRLVRCVGLVGPVALAGLASTAWWLDGPTAWGDDSSGVVDTARTQAEVTTSKDPLDPVWQDAFGLLDQQCFGCHDQWETKGGLDLMAIGESPLQVQQHAEAWEKALRQIRNRQMPPAHARQPTEAERLQMADAIDAVLRRFDKSEPTDPGPTPLRRLTHVEYQNTLRDLTGLDRPWADGFPADAGGGEGFTNHAPTLFVSPLLMEKYVSVAHDISQRVAFGPATGFAFEDQPFEDRGPNAYITALKQGEFDVRTELFEQLGVFVDDAKQLAVYLPVARDYMAAKQADAGLSAEAFVAALNEKNQRANADATRLEFVFVERLIQFANEQAKSDQPDRVGMAKLLTRFMAPAPGSQAGQVEEEGAVGGGDAEVVAENVVEDKRAAEAPPTIEKIVLFLNEHPAALRDHFSDAVGKRATSDQGGHWRFNQFIFMLNDDQLRARIGDAERQRFQRAIEDEWWVQHNADAAMQHAKRKVLAFVEKAFRHPLTEETKEAWSAFYQSAVEERGTHELAARWVVQRVLLSPEFLYRIETPRFAEAASSQNNAVMLGDGLPGAGATSGGGAELAVRLSYFLWASMPDQALLDAFAKDTSDDMVRRQVERMLKDPKAEALADTLFGEWLGASRLANHGGLNQEAYPDWSAEVKGLYAKQARAFAVGLIHRDASVDACLSEPVRYMNADLATLEGVSRGQAEAMGLDWDDPSMQAVACDPSQGGVFGLGAVHVITSKPTRTSPVLRGAWILDTVLGTPPPPPPPNAGDLPEAKGDLEAMTVRQRLEAHRNNPNCAACHARIDPLGFALEGLDAMGRPLEIADGQPPIDDEGQLPDGTLVDGVAGLQQALLKQKDLYRKNLIRRTLGYALGRQVENYDRPAMARIEKALEANGGRLSVLLTETALSLPFRARRLEAADGSEGLQADADGATAHAVLQAVLAE